MDRRPQHLSPVSGDGDILPVLRPRLPGADALMPWLRRMDAARQYSNSGPLSRLFEARLAACFGVAEGETLALASGTAGLSAALLALDLPRGALCVAPDWTFPGTLNAILAAGLVPLLVDVDPGTWALTPAIAERALAEAEAGGLGTVAAVMPVSPFGAPLPVAQWEMFRRETGVPVVIDAAAAFDATQPSTVPQILSLHATKAFGIGEGGLLLCRDAAFVAATRAAANFGFAGQRVPAVPAINAKLSEIHAAVGLAALDEWPDRRARLGAVADALLAAVGGVAGITTQPGREAGGWVASTFLVRLAAGLDLARIEAAMTAAGVETRRWWPVVMSDQLTFAACPRLPAPNARALCASVLGLPCSEDMTPAEAARVAAAIRSVTEAPLPA